MIKVIFTWRNDILGKLARKFGMRWSHVGLMHSDGLDLCVFEASMWGICHVTLVDFLDMWDEYEILATGQMPKETTDCLVAYAWGNVGKPYGFLMLLKMMVEFLKDKFFMRALTYPSHVCSSLVDECFNFVGIDLVPDKGRFVFPDDLYESDFLRRR